jgi:FMN phosphatase YigB (HAD superfamily)
MVRWPTVAAVDGAQDCLAALSGRVTLCVATNAGQSDRTMIERALDRVDLLRYIDRVFCQTEIGATKDRPEFWRAVSAGVGLPPSEIVMIGDSVDTDVLPSRRQGFQSVWYSREDGRAAAPADVPTVTRLIDFAELVLGQLRPSTFDDGSGRRG